MSHNRVDVQKHLRSACTTFRALRTEWEDARIETKDAMTIMANAMLELENVGAMALPPQLDSKPGLREGMKTKRAAAVKKAREAVVEYQSHIAEIGGDFSKLASEQYFASLNYDDDGPVFRTLSLKTFREQFQKVTAMYARDIDAKLALLKRFFDSPRANKRKKIPCSNRDAYLVIISSFVLDPYLDQDVLREFDELILKAELQ